MTTPIRTGALLALLTCSIAHAADRVERTVVMAGPPEGYTSVRVPTLAVMKDGSILLQCQGKAGKGDWVPAEVLQLRSTDGGKTWSTPTVLFKDPKTTVNAYPIVSRDGTLHLL